MRKLFLLVALVATCFMGAADVDAGAVPETSNAVASGVIYDGIGGVRDGVPDSTAASFAVLNRVPPAQEERGAVEFSVPTPPAGAVLLSATFRGGIGFNSTGSSTYELSGYDADASTPGTITTGDFFPGTVINTFANNGGFSQDVTAFVESRISAGAALLGFLMRQTTQQVGRKTHPGLTLEVCWSLCVPQIYWTEILGGTIRRAEADGSGVVDILTGLDEPFGLDVDAANGHIYFTEHGSEHTVKRCDLDGANLTTIIPNGTLNRPSSITVDTVNGHLYVSQWRSAFTQTDVPAGTALVGLHRFNLDGTGLTLLNADSIYGMDVALDLPNSRMFVATGTPGGGPLADTLASMDLAGGSVSVLHGPASTPSARFPAGVGLDPANNHVYWSSLNAGVHRSNMTGPPATVQLVPDFQGSGFSFERQPRGLELDLPNGHMYWAAAPRYGGVFFTGDPQGGDIRRANLDGTGLTVLVPGLDSLGPMDVELVFPNVAVSCPADQLAECGAPHNVDLLVEQCSGEAVTVQIEVDGNVEQTTNLAASTPGNQAIVGFSFNYTGLGVHTVDVTVTASPSGATDSCSFDVTLVDTTPPVISLLGTTPVTHECGSGPYVDAGATALDACEGDLTSSIVVGGATVDPNTAGTYVITYDVSDSTGNPAAQVTRTVNVVDTIPPVITCNLIRTMLWPARRGIIPVGLSASALDQCDGAVSVVVTVFSDEANGPPPFSPDATGTSPALLRLRMERAFPGGDGRVYLIRVTATDAAGNTSIMCKSSICPVMPAGFYIVSARAQAAAGELLCLAADPLVGIPAGYTQLHTIP